MFSVIFEVYPKEERFDEYLSLAKNLKPILEKIDGFIDNERFESNRRTGWILSHSTWRDEKSLLRWRTTEEHHMTQEKGRNEILRDYHLRVGDVFSDSNPPDEAPVREQRFDETEVAVAKTATLTEVSFFKGVKAVRFDDIPKLLGFDVTQEGVTDYDIFSSIYNPGKFALLVSWKNAETAKKWEPEPNGNTERMRHREIRVVRDYGMFDRRESPQYYPDVPGHTTLHPKLKGED
jgi:heme-degrading monooxygenase HmoA